MPSEYESRQQAAASLGFSHEEERLLINRMRKRASRNLIPKRYVFSLLSFTACCISKSYNMNLSIAIVSMIQKHEATVNKTYHNASLGTTSYKMESLRLEWNAEVVSFALAAVFYGQMISFIPGGRMAELYGGKRMLCICMLLSGIATVVSPLAAILSPYAFIVARILIGIGSGPVIPVIFYMLPRWIPETERSFHASLILSGFGVGSFLSVIVSGALCGMTFLDGWPLVFYVGGICGLLWVLLCAYFMYENPDEDPTMGEEEYAYIQSGLDTRAKETIPSIPWKDMALSTPLWALAIGFFGQFWLLGFFSTVLSVYIGTVLNISVVKNGILSSLPPLLRAFTSCMSSHPVDLLLRKRIVSVGFVRKGVTLINSLVACAAFLGLTFVGRNVTASTLLFILGALLGEYVTFGVCMACVDIAPSLSGTVSGLMNIIGVFPFFIIPSLTGWITNYENSIEKWRKVFYASIAVVLVSTVVFLIFGDLRPQPWGVSQDSKKEKEGEYEEILSDSDPEVTESEKKENDPLVH